jgi:hypothetical protein
MRHPRGDFGLRVFCADCGTYVVLEFSTVAALTYAHAKMGGTKLDLRKGVEL